MKLLAEMALHETDDHFEFQVGGEPDDILYLIGRTVAKLGETTTEPASEILTRIAHIALKGAD